MDTPSGSVESVLINKNDTLIFASLRYFGVVILNFDPSVFELEKLVEIE